MSQLLILISVSFISCLLLTVLARKVAFRFGIVANPNPIVKTHVTATPFLGGVAVYFAYICGLMSVGAVDDHFALIACLGLMTGLGLYDDIKPLSALQKLIGQILISILALWVLGGYSGEEFSLFRFAVYVFLLVFTTNALNLIDVMDGLATGVSAIALLGLFLVTLVYDTNNPNLPALALAATSLGFLPFNFYRAKIFLGDAGSLTLGFAFGLFTLVLPQSKALTETPIIAMLLFLIPIFELVFIFVMRSLKGIPFWKGSRDHYSLRLLSAGWSVPYIVSATYIFAILLTLAAVTIAGVQSLMKWLIVAVIALSVFFIWKRLSIIKVPVS